MWKVFEDISRNVHLCGRVLYENRSKIELGAGLVGSAAATIWIACRATRLPDETEDLAKRLDEADKAAKIAKEKIESGEGTPMDIDIVETVNKEKLRIFKAYVIKCGKMFGLPAALKLLSDILIVLAFKTEHDAASRAIAAYNVLEASFAEYRAKMKEELGDQREEDIYNGIRYETVDKFDPETGETYKELVKKWGKGYGPWSCEFARGKTVYFNDEFDYNLCLITGRERFLNQTLRMKGVVTMVDVWDSLGMLETRSDDEIAAGLEFGWVRNKRYPDTVIDIGIKEFAAIPQPEKNSPLNEAIPLNINPMGRIKDFLCVKR